MIRYIKGELAFVDGEGIVVDHQGIGYEILVPQNVLENLPPVGKEIKIYTYLYVREDAMRLFGFMTREDLSLFQMLITVNGIGPKGALGILSAIPPEELKFAILSEDKKMIAKAPGIGAKTAGKLILELKDKLSLKDAFEQKYANVAAAVSVEYAEDVRGEAVQALTALGISGTDAFKAVRKVEVTEGMTAEEVLKLSLKQISAR